MIIKLPFDKREKDFMKFLQLVEDGGHILDIGANIGVMTYHFSKKFNNSTVHSFEPITINYQVLGKIIKKLKLGNVKVYRFALGDVAGEIEMILPKSRKVYLHGLSYVNEKQEHVNGIKFKVDVKRLDDIEELKDKKINAIKLDVEEFEFKVLKGAHHLIERNRPIIYTELWESKNRYNSINYLSLKKYKVFVNINNKLTEYTDQKGYQNFFFIPEEHCDKLKL